MTFKRLRRSSGRPTMLFIALLLLAVTGVCLVSATESTEGFDHCHQMFSELLTRHVHDARVDYQGLGQDREVLQQYLGSLAELQPAVFDSFSKAQQLALLINAYNAFTLELILRNYPVASIRDIPGAWDEVRWTLGGQQLTLNQIEHERIRQAFAEPRIHFALVCAAIGCPPLAAEAYRAAALEEQLATGARRYVQDKKRNRLDRGTSTLHISKILEWYGDDFELSWGKSTVPQGSDRSPRHRAIVGFFIEHLSQEDADFLRQTKVNIAYLEYDWGLNDWRPE